MAITFPIALPSVRGPRSITIRKRSAVGMTMSPMSFAQQRYVHSGELWEMVWRMPPMQRAAAEDWVGWLVSLNGREGSFLCGPDYPGTTPRGTWAGSSPVVDSAHAAGVKTVQIRDVLGLTWKRGDWLQFGSGSSSRLHKVTQDGSQAGSPTTGILEIWPRTRAALADGDPITLASPKGVFGLASNVTEWSIELAQRYGVEFSAIEVL